MQRALAHQTQGRADVAAGLYEAALAIEPDVFDALNMLAVLRAASGNVKEAFELGRRAGELSHWSVDMVNHNFAYICRAALSNADSTRAARLMGAYQSWLDSVRGDVPETRTISVILHTRGTPSALSYALGALARAAVAPIEVVIPADLLASVDETPPSLRMRVVTVAARNEAERLNALCDAAGGDYLLALRATELIDASRIAALASSPSAADCWSIAIADDPADRQLNALLAESPTLGFALLAAGDRIDVDGAMLVPRQLHQAIGGYRAGSASTLRDYALRLLWQAEPLPLRYQPSVAHAARDSAKALPECVSDYLRTALDDKSAPNIFAPALANWGVYLSRQVVNAGSFPAPDVMARINDTIAHYLARKHGRAIQTKPGLNLVGPARGEFGLAENMRAFARACLEGGTPCAVRDLNLALRTRQGDMSLAEHFAEEASHDCSVFFLNPDSRQLYDQSLDAVVFERPTLDFRHYKIGYWFWELEKIPTQWDYAMSKVDEIWVATEFVAQAIRSVTDKPVIKIPTPISFEVTGKYDRRHFDLPEDKFLFLFSFDFNSFAERKNPHGLVRAFRKAFPAHRRDVVLVIKSINGGNRPDAVEALFDMAQHDPRILLRDAFLSRDEVFGLQSISDCFVSLHRAEGLGLGLAECMYQGKPVIGTGYSGNLEFMNEENSALVRYSLVSIGRGEYLYDDPGFFWAEPDEDHAAELMRRMVDDVEYRQRLALRGQQDLRARFSNASAANSIAQRLQLLGLLEGSGKAAAVRESRPGTGNQLDEINRTYRARGSRPELVHLLSKSLPRSGHHHLVDVLSTLYGDAFDYCEYYQASAAECCKSEPCTRFCSSTRFADRGRHVSMQKSHDFQLADPIMAGHAWLKYVIMTRDFSAAVQSEIKLLLIDHFSSFLAEHDIDARRILQRHEKPLYRRALELIDEQGLRMPLATVDTFLDERFVYYRHFAEKWPRFARRHPAEALVIRYDELVGEQRRATVDSLVGFIGIDPVVPIDHALADWPVLSIHDRKAEQSQAAAELVEARREILSFYDGQLRRMQ